MKKLFALLLILVMLLSMTACGAKEKITLYAETVEGDDVMLAVDFYYPAGKVTVDNSLGYLESTQLKYTDKNILISPTICEDTTFDETKAYAKENEETYTEFKITGYDCFAHEDFGGYWIYVQLEDLSENTDRYLLITTEAIDNTADCKEGVAQYKDGAIKQIVESFEYRGVVAYPEAETTK